MNKLRSIILWGVALLVLAWTNFLIFQQEQLIAEGRSIFLELAPVDPRSLIQGDYMMLRYAMTNNLDPNELTWPGTLVITLDERKIATFVRLHDPEQPLAAGELLLEYHRQGNTIYLGAESFFFQEGHAHYYEQAKYGELRVTESGESTLVGLRGANLEPLGPP
ncbi:MAG: GDYXXLXY domain-containing protein [Ardenticatenaceae bacterium]